VSELTQVTADCGRAALQRDLDGSVYSGGGNQAFVPGGWSHALATGTWSMGWRIW